MTAALTSAAVALGRALREAGVATGVDQEVLFCRAVAELDAASRTHVYWAGRAAFVRSAEDLAAYEPLFARFWKGVPLGDPEGVTYAGESDPRVPGTQHGGESTPQFRMEGRSSHLLDGQPMRATREIPAAPAEDPGAPQERTRRGVLAAYSPEEVLPAVEAFDWEAAELAAVRRLADELRAAAPQRVSRRLQPGRRRGPIDLRRTLRNALRTDGEPLHPAWSGPSQKPRRVVVLCDVSGSMERYSRALLAALGGVVGSGLQAEAFVFATRLTRLTGSLRGRDAGPALDRARASVEDWAGGTRIGAAIEEFNRVWGRRGFARGAIVIVVSDGWDRGDPELLARELARLRLQARRLAWINPRPSEIGGQQLAVGMRAAMPHLDDFVVGHDAAALATLIGGFGGGRPSRPQRTS